MVHAIMRARHSYASKPFDPVLSGGARAVAQVSVEVSMNGEHFSVKSGVIYTYQYKVSSVAPLFGPIAGGTGISVSGVGFLPAIGPCSANASCRIGGESRDDRVQDTPWTRSSNNTMD